MTTWKPMIAVVGGVRASAQTLCQAEALGGALVTAGFRVVTGGLGGVMAAVARGARRSGAWTGHEVLGILPGWEPDEGNPWTDIPLQTSLGRYRNTLVAESCHAMVGLGGQAGTLSELALAWQERKPLAVLGTEGWAGRLAGQALDDRGPEPVVACRTVEDVVRFLTDLFPLGCFSGRGQVQWFHGEVPCLHRIHDPQAAEPLWPGHEVQRQLGFSLPLDEVKRRLEDLSREVRSFNERFNARRRALVTFDDGYRDVHLLRETFLSHPGLQPVLFVNTDLLRGSPQGRWFDVLYESAEGAPVADLMRWRQVLRSLPEQQARERAQQRAGNRDAVMHRALLASLSLSELQDLDREGWIIGSHGPSHEDLTKWDDAALTEGLCNALDELLRRGGRPWLAYPDGRWDERLRNAALAAGFTMLFTIDNELQRGTPYHVDRRMWLGEKTAEHVAPSV